MFNDSLDFIYGTDKSRIDNKNPFSGGSGVLTSGLIQPKMVLFAVFILYLVAFVCALYLAYEVGLASLGIAVLGAFVSIFYSAKPLRFAYHGVGELMMFLGYGPIITSWAYYIHTGQLNPDVFFIGAIPGLLMWAMILINEIPDHAEDREAGKRNITYHLGPRLTKNLFISSLLFIYFYIGVLLLIGVLPVTAALVYIGIPLALKAALVSHNHFKDPIRVAESNKYMVLVYSVTTVAVAIGLLV
jgi:1,4-dihydroxy-2-naphthoate octaprenyltransferase